MLNSKLPKGISFLCSGKQTHKVTLSSRCPFTASLLDMPRYNFEKGKIFASEVAYFLSIRW